MWNQVTRPALAFLLATGCASSAPPEPQPVVAPAPGIAVVGAMQRSGDQDLHDSQDSRAEADQPASRLEAGAEAETELRETNKLVDPMAAELCEAVCVRLEKQCPASVAEDCRIDCTLYQTSPSRCSSHVHRALDCARKASDLACVKVAPGSCTRTFRELAACIDNREVEPSHDALAIPRGWRRVSFHGLSIAMPPDAKSLPARSGSRPELVATEGANSYSVRVLPKPENPTTEGNAGFVTQAALDRCKNDVRVFSVVERPERFSSRFSANCPDQSALKGQILLLGSKLYVFSVQGPDPSGDKLEAFLYGFEQGAGSSNR